jgi:lipopolysaccharide biosynthesis regulator YciM
VATLIFVVVVSAATLALGIYIGRYYVPDDRALHRAVRHARAYSRAIQHILSRNHDGAITELKNAVAEDESDLEPYFALGSLFRTRGEHERAIRVHQALELRAGDQPQTALRARFELGLDFRAAGMPRRAIRAMEECLLADPRHEGALRALSALYESQKRYEEAATAWARLDARGEDARVRARHLWAAASERAALEGDLAAARRALYEAEKFGARHPHVLCASAILSAAEGDPGRARQTFIEALIEAPELAPFIVPTLCRIELDSEDAQQTEPVERPPLARTLQALDNLPAETRAHPLVQLAIAELYERHGETDRAREAFSGAALADPTLVAARLGLARFALAQERPDAVADELRMLVSEGGPLTHGTLAGWRCDHCGTVQPTFAWRCDECNQWGTLSRAVMTGRPTKRRRDRRLSPRHQALLPAPEKALDTRPGWFGSVTTLLHGVRKSLGGKRS